MNATCTKPVSTHGRKLSQNCVQPPTKPPFRLSASCRFLLRKQVRLLDQIIIRQQQQPRAPREVTVARSAKNSFVDSLSQPPRSKKSEPSLILTSLAGSRSPTILSDRSSNTSIQRGFISSARTLTRAPTTARVSPKTCRAKKEKDNPLVNRIFLRRIQINNEPRPTTARGAGAAVLRLASPKTTTARQNKAAFRGMLESYRVRAARESQRMMEDLMGMKERRLEESTATGRCEGKKAGKRSHLEEAIELQERLLRNPSKYQCGFELEIQMRQAYRKREVEMTESDSDVLRSKLTNSTAGSKIGPETEPVARDSGEAKENMKSLEELDRKINCDEPVGDGYRNAKARNFFYAVKQGDLKTVIEMSKAEPGLVREVDNVTTL